LNFDKEKENIIKEKQNQIAEIKEIFVQENTKLNETIKTMQIENEKLKNEIIVYQSHSKEQLYFEKEKEIFVKEKENQMAEMKEILVQENTRLNEINKKMNIEKDETIQK
jgi:hypothetical protein